MAETTRYRIRTPDLATAPPDIPRDMRVLADELDPRLSPVNVGLRAARPAFGRIGQYYYATDDRLTYLDIGPEWITVGGIPAEFVRNEMIARATIRGERIADETIEARQIRAETIAGEDIRRDTVTKPLLNREMRPEAGAASEAEALRRLGTNAGDAFAGNSALLRQGRNEVETVRRVGVGREDAASGADARLTDDRTPIRASVVIEKFARGREGPAAGCFSAWLENARAGQRIGPSRSTLVRFDQEDFDVSGWYAVETGRFTPLIAGYYRFSVAVGVGTLRAEEIMDIYIYKNRTLAQRKIATLMGFGEARQGPVVCGSCIEVANGREDTFEVQVLHNNAGEKTIPASQNSSYFQGEFIGPS